MQEYFHQADVSMRRHHWTEEEEAEKVKPGPGLSLLVPVVLDPRLLICQHSVQHMSRWLILLRQTSSRNVDKEAVEVSLHGQRERW